MEVVSRADVGDTAWDTFVYDHPLGWFWHTSQWLAYSLAYTPQAVDHSFMVVDHYEPLALVPLVQGPNGSLVMGGQITPAPLFNFVSGPDMALANFAITSAEKRLRGHVALPIRLRPGIVPQGLMPESCQAQIGSTYVVDLRVGERELWKNLRKSYKSLIHKAQREFAIATYAKDWAVDIARELHLVSAGRETRPRETWECMKQWVVDGQAVVALGAPAVRSVPKNDRSAVAYAYAIRYKRCAYYASGASLDKSGLAHALQWELMNALRCGDISMYEIGYAADADATEKEKGIAHFKAGFGGKALPVVVVSPARM